MSASLLLDLNMPDQNLTRKLSVHSTVVHLSRSVDIAEHHGRSQRQNASHPRENCLARHTVVQDVELDQADAVDFQPGWPQGRNWKEEELANAAESRLLSIVAQLKTGDDGQDRSNTAAQVISCRGCGVNVGVQSCGLTMQ